MRAIASSMVLCIFLAACNGPSRSSTGTATTSESLSIGKTPVSEVRHTRPVIAWPPASRIDVKVRSELSLDSRERIARSPVPVLVPKGMEISDVVLSVDTEYYALAAKLPSGATLSVQGVRAQIFHEEVPPIPGDVKIRDGMGHVTENEGIRVATFIENGASYSVDLECGSNTDPRCKDDAAVRAIAEALVFVGGAGSQ